MVNLLSPIADYINMGVEDYRKLEKDKKFNEIERLFITPFYSRGSLFTICGESDYADKFKNCDLQFDQLVDNLNYVNENYSLVDEFFRDYMAKDEGFKSEIKDADEIELGKFLSNEERSILPESTMRSPRRL